GNVLDVYHGSSRMGQGHSETWRPGHASSSPRQEWRPCWHQLRPWVCLENRSQRKRYSFQMKSEPPGWIGFRSTGSQQNSRARNLHGSVTMLSRKYPDNGG